MKTRQTVGRLFALAIAALALLSSAHAATNWWDGGNVDILTSGNGASAGGTGTWSTAIANWDVGSGLDHVPWNNDNNDFAIFGGTAGLVTVATPVTVSGMSFTTAGYIISNSTITLTGNAVINNAGTATIKSVLGGSGGLTKTGAGTLYLYGNNTYSGGTQLAGGSISDLNANSFGTGAITVTANTTIVPTYGAFPVFTNSLAVNSGVTLTIAESTQYYGITFSNVVSGSGTIVYGGGNDANTRESLGLNNAANTFTGTLKSSGGSATVSVNSLGDGGSVILNGGTFILNSGTAAPLLFNSRQFMLAGSGTINNGNASTANTITINTDLLVTTNGNKTLTLGGSNTGNNTFGGKIANGIGAVISLTKADAGTWILSNTNNSYTGATEIQGGTLVITSIGNVGGGPSSLGAPTNTTSGTIKIGSTTTATLRYTGTGSTSDRVIDLAGTTSGATLDQSGGGLWKFTSNLTASGAGKKTLTLTGSTDGIGQLAGAIVDNSVVNTTSVTKAGTGLWVLSGTNTYSGATTINAGALEAVDGVGLPTSSILQLRGGVFQSSGTFSRAVGTAAGAVNWSTSSGGFAARGGVLTIQLNGGTGTMTWNGSSFVPTGQALIFGSTTADDVVDFQNRLKLAASGNNNVMRTITVIDNPNSTSDRARISGDIFTESLTNGIVKNGNGVLELTAANTYNGPTIVSNGTLLVNNTTGFGTGSGAVTVVAGATLGGTGAVATLTLQSGAVLSPGSSPGTLTVNTLTMSAGSTNIIEITSPALALGTYDVVKGSSVTFGGVLSLTFSGGTYTNGSTVQVYDYTTYASNFDAVVWSGLPGSQQATFDPLTGYVTVIPEPGPVAMVGGGLALLVVLRRRRK